MTDKCNMLCVLSVLQKYSDRDHVLSIKDINEKLEHLYEKTADRRTIYGAIQALTEFGYDISGYDENGRGYYLDDRAFTTGEIKLLVDAVYSCKYISPSQTGEILKKLTGMLSDYDREKFRYTNIIAPDKKTENREVFLNIETIDEAIESKRKISFEYYDYGYDKTLIQRRDRRYTGSPYAMTCQDEHYYMAFVGDGHSEAYFYRIDMMKDIKILDEKRTLSKKDAGLENIKKVVYAHTGTPERIRMHCKQKALRYVIEEFGKDTTIIKCADGSFDAVVSAAPSGVAYWALKYLDLVEILSPESLRNKIADTIKNNPYVDMKKDG